MTGLNIANETVEKRSFIVQQIVALALTVGATILAIVGLAAFRAPSHPATLFAPDGGRQELAWPRKMAASCDSCLLRSRGHLSTWPFHGASHVEMGHLGRCNCDGPVAGDFGCLFLLYFPISGRTTPLMARWPRRSSFCSGSGLAPWRCWRARKSTRSWNNSQRGCARGHCRRAPGGRHSCLLPENFRNEGPH